MHLPLQNQPTGRGQNISKLSETIWACVLVISNNKRKKWLFLTVFFLACSYLHPNFIIMFYVNSILLCFSNKTYFIHIQCPFVWISTRECRFMQKIGIYVIRFNFVDLAHVNAQFMSKICSLTSIYIGLLEKFLQFSYCCCSPTVSGTYQCSIFQGKLTCSALLPAREVLSKLNLLTNCLNHIL